MTATTASESVSDHANFAVVVRAGELIANGFTTPHEGLFTDDFVFHFFNAMLPDLAGDYHGRDGLQRFFAQLRVASEGTFHNEPHSLTAFGDELVAAYATNTMEFAGSRIEVDALVVWRVVDRRIREAWDIPAINTVRPHNSPS